MSPFILAAPQNNECKVNISLLNQDPYPAIPGEYVKIVFKVTGLENKLCNGLNLQLVPLYPFSLDNNDTLRTTEGSNFIQEQNTEWLVPYKLRVDKDAISGDNEIKLNYKALSSVGYITQTFYIDIEDSRTNFDAVIQEVSGSDVSIAIANTGKYTANSVIVKIPKQDSFRASGTDGQMVGNLESGDYTIVSFTIQSSMQRNMTRNTNSEQRQAQNNNLKFDISYTDTLGERRVVNMELPLSMNSNSTTFRNLSQRQSSQSNIFIKYYYWIIAIVVIIILFIIYKKRTNLKDYLKKDKHKEIHTPDWVKNSKEKEKSR
jgi:hypothetical protein